MYLRPERVEVAVALIPRSAQSALYVSAWMFRKGLTLTDDVGTVVSRGTPKEMIVRRNYSRCLMMLEGWRDMGIGHERCEGCPLNMSNSLYESVAARCPRFGCITSGMPSSLLARNNPCDVKAYDNAG